MRHCASCGRLVVWATALVLLLAPAAVFATTLYQIGTMGSLAAGDYAGRERYGVLARHGDFGLGTFSGLDGEMIALDGRFYQVTSDGIVHAVRPSQQAPFAQVTFFTGALDLGRVDGMTLPQIIQAMTARLPDPSRFYAVRIDGLFATVTARSAPAQKAPWPPLAEAVKAQSLFPLENVQGTLVGLYSPTGLSELSPAGWHFHFLSADRRHGGHALKANVVVGKARGDRMDKLEVLFPEHPAPHREAPRPAAGTE